MPEKIDVESLNKIVEATRTEQLTVPALRKLMQKLQESEATLDEKAKMIDGTIVSVQNLLDNPQLQLNEREEIEKVVQALKFELRKIST